MMSYSEDLTHRIVRALAFVHLMRPAHRTVLQGIQQEL